HDALPIYSLKAIGIKKKGDGFLRMGPARAAAATTRAGSGDFRGACRNCKCPVNQIGQRQWSHEPIRGPRCSPGATVAAQRPLCGALSLPWSVGRLTVAGTAAG